MIIIIKIIIKLIKERSVAKRARRVVFDVFKWLGLVSAILYIYQHLKKKSNLWPRFSKRALLAIMILALVTVQIYGISAYEAHIINVTAQIVNDVPDISVDSGNFCETDLVEIEIFSSLPDAVIIYTLDGLDPVCGLRGQEYGGKFVITESKTLKARACHDNTQSMIVSETYEVGWIYCDYCCGDGVLDPGEECDDGNNIDGDGCSADCTLECEYEGFCSQTMGGWSQTCQENNVGCLRDNYWDEVTGGSLAFGQGHSITLSNSGAAENFFPQGNTPQSLSQSHVDPATTTEAGVLGGQIGALKLNILYSDAGIGLIGASSGASIGELLINSGKFAGLSVRNFLTLAEIVLGGGVSQMDVYGADISELNDTAALINENFVDCEENNGYLALPECYDPNPVEEAGFDSFTTMFSEPLAEDPIASSTPPLIIPDETTASPTPPLIIPDETTASPTPPLIIPNETTASPTPPLIIPDETVASPTPEQVNDPEEEGGTTE